MYNNIIEGIRLRNRVGVGIRNFIEYGITPKEVRGSIRDGRQQVFDYLLRQCTELDKTKGSDVTSPVELIYFFTHPLSYREEQNFGNSIFS